MQHTQDTSAASADISQTASGQWALEYSEVEEKQGRCPYHCLPITSPGLGRPPYHWKIIFTGSLEEVENRIEEMKSKLRLDK